MTVRSWLAVNVAVTCRLAFRVTTQVGPLLQLPPVQPLNDEFAPGVSVRVTCVPGGKLAVQVGFGGQVIPVGLLVTVPVPVPARTTVNTGERLKVAVTAWFPLSVIMQVLLLPQFAPIHPAKYEFATGAAVSVTCVPRGKLAVQVGFGGQVIPTGLLVTLPVPFPARVTVNIGAAWIRSKIAVTF